MANRKISGLTNSLTKSTVATNDLTVVVDTSASESKKMTYGEFMSPQDNNFRIAGSSDNTKLLAFEVDGLTTATTRTLTVPDANTTIVGTDTTQTLTNKTLTSPQVNFGSDATGDMIYRTSGGSSARLPIGTAGQIIQVSSGGIPEYIANPAVSDASTTVKGSVELGTQAEVDAGTGTPSTTASLIPTIGTTRARLLNTGVVDTGSSTAYAIAPTPVITAYATYQEFTFKAVNANTTTTPTVNVNGVGAKTIVNPNGGALKVGQIPANSIVKIVYDGTNFQLFSATGISVTYAEISPTTKSLADASTTQNIAHGLGVIPNKIKLTFISNFGTTSPGGIAVFTYIGTTKSVVGYVFSNGALRDMAGTDIILYEAGNNTQFQTGVISKDATNIIITWTKTNSPTGTYGILVEAEA